MTVSAVRCPKCDSLISKQTDGSTIQFDIAHHGETVREAMANLERWLYEARQDLPRFVRVIVGTGRIREEALGWLRDAEYRGDILSVETTESNRGQILVQIKP